MSYQSVYELAQEEQLLQRLTVAVADVVDDVFVESAATPNHDVRLAMVSYAGPEFSAYKRFAREMILQLLQTTGITNDSTDAEIKTAVAALWTPYALLLEAGGKITVAA